MTFLEWMIAGTLAVSTYHFLFAITLRIINVDYDVSFYLIAGYLGIMVLIILVSLQILLYG